MLMHNQRLSKRIEVLEARYLGATRKLWLSTIHCKERARTKALIDLDVITSELIALINSDKVEML
jgi:hypothetical protein